MKNYPKGILVILFTTLFNFFFWREKFGLNLVLFSFVFSGILYSFNPDTRHKSHTLIAIAGILISSFGVLYHNSFYSKFMLFCSLFLFLASLMEREIKTIYHLIPSGFLSVISTPFRKHTFFKSPKTNLSAKSLRYLKLSIIPLLITILFIVIYSIANPVFAEKWNYIYDNLGNYLANIFKHYPIGRFVFIGIGLLLGIGVFYYRPSGIFNDWAKNYTSNLERKKLNINTSQNSGNHSILALKTEKNSAVLTLILLNCLLLFVNLLDINVFFIQKESINSNYSNELHKGTWMLIFSIVLSASIVLYIFRKNLNFYRKNSILRGITYVWIGQNVILAISVIARVYYYIEHHGLAYKRIGVVIFVSATIVGLFTLAYKVKKKKTISFLFKTNGLSIFLILLFTSLFNWDVIIAKHNLANARVKKIDYLFELSLSDKTLPILDQNRDKFVGKNNTYRSYSFEFPWIKKMSLTERLNQRIENYKTKQKNNTWLSWNLSDYKTQAYFNSKN
ncbi:MAG: hypothetical protein CMP67_02680 [Flavobacteriales bacterium]|nr:hypothetical protein [Flavobacteriales bacterium]|tara:strand:+ start:2528 stop:4045 length:1518 start_codon:yes stop_codon:yes gene_type:complete